MLEAFCKGLNGCIVQSWTGRPCSGLLDRLGSTDSTSLVPRLGLVTYGVVVRPHGPLRLLEVWPVLMSRERERERERENMS